MKNAKILMLLFIVIITALNAQNSASISGVIKNLETQKPLVGANIVLKNSPFGTSSKSDGTFYINGIEPGRYVVSVSFIGFITVEKQIEIEKNQTLTFNVSLQPAMLKVEKVVVEAEKVYSTASSRVVRKLDMKIKPTRSAQDMLQLAPGLIIAQHAGGGKAEQIFLRGFDADHGTDVAIDVDGIPVNMVSHGHGQGYADLHFLIPEIVENIGVFKGPYFANYGNLATAGAVSFKTKDHIESNLVQVEGGHYGTAKTTALMQIPSTNPHQNAYFAGQFYTSDGPFNSPQDFKRFNLFGKYHSHITEKSNFSLSVGAFSSAWDASGQIPQRVVEKGKIDRFGAIDDMEGGITGRQNILLEYRIQGKNNTQFITKAYASNYDFKLYSNFTFFLEDSTHGDMIEQSDNRYIFGLNSSYKFAKQLGSIYAKSTISGGFRSDDIEVALWKSPNRSRVGKLVNSDIAERNFFLWIKEEILLSPKFSVQLGLRADYFTYNVEDHIKNMVAEKSSDLPHASGYHHQTIVSPKLNMVYNVLPKMDLFFNVGSGFHSNDARNVIIGKRIREMSNTLKAKGWNAAKVNEALQAQNFDPAQRYAKTLPRAIGAEFGIRTELFNSLHFGLSGWLLDMEKEYVYVGDAGTTELSGATRRIGIDLEARMGLLSWLWCDFDLNISEGRYVNAPKSENYIPLAPNITSTGGLTFFHPSGMEGNLRYRYIGDRPANEDNSVVALGYTLLNGTVAYKWNQIKLFATVENILNSQWNEAQFDTESRLKEEAAPVSEIHFTPGNARNVRLGIGYRF